MRRLRSWMQKCSGSSAKAALSTKVTVGQSDAGCRKYGGPTPGLSASGRVHFPATSRRSNSAIRGQRNMAIKLPRTYTAQLEALAKLRRGGEETVRVEHVHVHGATSGHNPAPAIPKFSLPRPPAPPRAPASAWAHLSPAAGSLARFAHLLVRL